MLDHFATQFPEIQGTYMYVCVWMHECTRVSVCVCVYVRDSCQSVFTRSCDVFVPCIVCVCVCV